MKNNIYIASTLTNAPRVRDLRDKFKAHQIGLSYDWTSHHGGELYVPDDKPEEKQLTAEREVRGVFEAKAILVVLPGERGTHFEFGLAFALQKPVVILADKHVGYSPAFHFLSDVMKVTNELEAIMAIVAFARGECKPQNNLMNLLHKTTT